MVFVEDIDENSYFEASLGSVWKLAEAHITDGSKIHPNTKNNKTEVIDDMTFLNSWTQKIVTDNGSLMEVPFKVKGTIFYPLGMAFEILEGQFAGSKFFTYYAPIEGEPRTRVNVVGDFKSTIITDDEKLKAAVMNFLQMAFDEDSQYLKKMT